MNRKWLNVLVLLGAFGLVSAGCKEVSCESVCEGLNKCEGKMQTADCPGSCDAARSNAEQIGCKDQYDALVGCQGAIDVCNADTLCAAQSAAFFKCASDACAADPSKCGGS